MATAKGINHQPEAGAVLRDIQHRAEAVVARLLNDGRVTGLLSDSENAFLMFFLSLLAGTLAETLEKNRTGAQVS